MTLAPRLKPMRVTGRRPCGRRDTGVHGGSRQAALTTAARAHLSAAALHFMRRGCAVPEPGLGRLHQERRLRRRAPACEPASSKADRHCFTGFIPLYLKPLPSLSFPVYLRATNDRSEGGPFWSWEGGGRYPQMRWRRRQRVSGRGRKLLFLDRRVGYEVLALNWERRQETAVCRREG